MSAFSDSTLPVLSTLAREFAVFDHWHCSCPCPTNPNREFLMSGTSHGKTLNDLPDEGFPQETHFAFLDRRNVSWKIYYHDDPWMGTAFADLREPNRMALVQEVSAFYTDVKKGTLPQYVLIQPRMSSTETLPANWQHPDNSVEEGEKLMKDVYEALRTSAYWEQSLLVITYDEHGGFFDHQPTPAEGVPAPDDVPGENGFDYSRLGVRIPTVMVSPFIAKGTVVSRPSGARAPTPTSQFDATSIISSVNKIFGIEEHMTRRDAWAGTFHDLVSARDDTEASESLVLRKDCPRELPTVQPMSAEQLREEMNRPFNDHHLDSINLLCHLSQHSHPVCARFADSAEHKGPERQLEFVRSLAPGRAAAAPLTGQFTMASTYPHLHPAAAPLLRQKHFEQISIHMFDLYKSRLLAQPIASME